MIFTETSIAGVWEIQPELRPDERGYFFESFRSDLFQQNIGNIDFIQDNESSSRYGVMRGMHYQLPPFAQSKLLRVVVGKIQDVAVDMRPGSATYRQHISVELSAEKHNQLFVPKGFAHGFATLSDVSILQYRVDAPYDHDSDRSISLRDPSLKIHWLVTPDELNLSDKDRAAPLFDDADKFLPGWDR